MSIDDLIWIVIIFIVSLVLVVGSINHTTPFNKRLKFNQICNDYQQKAIQNGYLSTGDIDSFIADLDEKGIVIIVLNVPQSKLEWGTEFPFEVEATYKQKELQVDFNKIEKRYNLFYKHKAKSMANE